MANFSENYFKVKPPPPKKKKNKEEILDEQKKYDMNIQERAFLPKWQNDYEWLVYHSM
jgi:hypothetical protein